MTSELNTKFEAVAAALREASDALHAIGQKRHTQAVCEAALDDLAAIRQAIEAARQSSGQERGEAVAWMTEDGERCVTERTMAGARKDGGAMLSSLSAYVVPLTYAHPPAATGSGEAVAWLRKNGFRFNADIEPQDDSEIPLYTHPSPDAGRVAELEREITSERELFKTVSEVLTEVIADRDRLEAQLTASREREGRMREALDSLDTLCVVLMPEYKGSRQHMMTQAALAAEKGEK